MFLRFIVFFIDWGNFTEELPQKICFKSLGTQAKLKVYFRLS